MSHTKNKKGKMRLIFRKIRLFILEHFYTLLVKIRFSFKNKLINEHKLDQKLIVSLTSFPPRFEKLHLTVKTLLSQSLKPDIVILCLYKNDLDKLPSSVTSMEGDSFKIISTDRDTRSFKKLIPTLRLFPGNFIVTADDDVYYKRNWLKVLVDNYDSDKREVIGCRAHKIRFDEEERLLPYREWNYRIKKTQSDESVFLTGVGGIFYPPNSLDKEVLNENAFLELCPTSDDIWFYFMLRKANFVGKKVGGRFPIHNWLGTQEIALNHQNLNNFMNDEAMRRMTERYGEVFTNTK